MNLGRKKIYDLIDGLFKLSPNPTLKMLQPMIQPALRAKLNELSDEDIRNILLKSRDGLDELLKGFQE
jgi:hypothetical protein